MPQATGTAGGGGGSSLVLLLPLLLIGYLFFTQRRRQRATLAQQQAIEVGQEVRTTSGLYGRIVALDGSVATLEVSPGVHLRYDRRAIAGQAALGVSSPAADGTSEPVDGPVVERVEPFDGPSSPPAGR